MSLAKRCAEAAREGNLELLKTLHAPDNSFASSTTQGNVKNVHSCDTWDKLTCKYAAMKGHLDCLIYAHEPDGNVKNGCP